MRAAVLTIAVLLVVGAIVVFAVGGSDDGAGAPTAHIAFDKPGRAVPAQSAGLSVEWDAVTAYRTPAFPRLLRRLARESGSPVHLRIGGNSSDQSWWNPDGEPRPRTVLFDITPRTLDDLAWIVQRSGARVTLGVNLALNDPARAVAFARAAQRRLPRGSLAALEIGNEPDLYASEREFDVGRLRLRRLRKRDTYGPAEYERELRGYVDALSSGLDPAPPLIVGGFADGELIPALSRLVGREAGRVGGLSTHLYALRRCEDPTPPAELIERLGDPETTRAMVDRAGPMLELGRRHGLPVRITELNSAVCGGVPGVSDTFAATLWLADALFELTRAGAAGSDVHGFPGAFYTPVDVRGRRAVPRPPYSGMLLYHRAAPRGSRLLPVQLDDAPESVRAWATLDRRGRARVLLTSTEELGDPVRVVVPASAGRCAAVERLRARTLESDAVAELVDAGRACPRDGAYSVRVDGPGAVVLEFQARKPS